MHHETARLYHLRVGRGEESGTISPLQRTQVRCMAAPLNPSFPLSLSLTLLIELIQTYVEILYSIDI